MIAAGLVAEAEAAAQELRDALVAAGVFLPLTVDPRVWECEERGLVRLAELGSVLPDIALKLAAVVRKGCREVVRDDIPPTEAAPDGPPPPPQPRPLAELRQVGAVLGDQIDAHLKELRKP